MVTDMVTDMVMDMSMETMIDIHNHYMYGVDDGAVDLEMSKALFFECKKQGISTIFLTPHVNSSVTYANRSEHIKRFKILEQFAREIGINIYLGAEIYISFRLPKLDFDKYTMGNNKTILVEFSPHIETPIIDHVHNLKCRGFKIIIAHVERYRYLSFENLLELKDMGIYLQVNASSILKQGSRESSKIARKLVKLGIIDFVATDSHNLKKRPPRLNAAFKELVKMIGKAKANKLVYENQFNLLLNV